MGVLKIITDEYFGDTISEEDGKYIVIRGCRIVVPHNYDEIMFFKKVQEILNETKIEIVEKNNDFRIDELKEKGFTEVSFKNNFSFLMQSIDEIDDEYKDIYKSYMIFMEYILKDIELYYNDKNWDKDEYSIILANSSEIEDIYDCYDYDYTIDEIIPAIENEFFNKFKDDAKIIRNELWSTEFFDIFYMYIKNYTGNIQLYTLLYASEMREWWKNKINEVCSEGVKKSLGLNPDEYEEEE